MSTPPEELRPEELLPEELRDLHIGRPRPELRQETFRALRRALDEPAPSTGSGRLRRWWREWRIELSFAGATLVAASFLGFCLLSPICHLPSTLRPEAPAPFAGSTPAAAELEELGPYARTWLRAVPGPRRLDRRDDHAVITRELLDRI